MPADFKNKVEDLGCWRDTSNRAIPPIEGQHPDLKDNFQQRTNAFNKCFKAALEMGTVVIYRI